MRSTLQAIGVLVGQFSGIVFCAFCALTILLAPLAAFVFLMVAGFERDESPISLWMPIFFVMAWFLLIRILALSIENFHDFSSQRAKKIGVFSGIIVAGFALMFLQLS